jgi:hypothetical protein
MDRSATTPATARDIIQEIVRNMQEGLEPLHYTTIAPSIFHVYLHPDDLDRLRGILPRVIDEARRALDAEVEQLNRATIGERLKIARRNEPKVETPTGGWQIRFLENTDDDSEPGDVMIQSELGLPAKTEFGAGSMTKRIATRRNQAAKASYVEAPQAAAPVAAPAPDPGTLAVIQYDDGSGSKSFYMTKEQIVVGRGGRDYWTDLKLNAVPDVSREHCRLRRDPADGKFYLKDLSRLGTTINGEPAPSSIEIVDGEKRDRNLEVPLPEQARIGLANVVFLEFRSTPNG